MDKQELVGQHTPTGCPSCTGQMPAAIDEICHLYAVNRDLLEALEAAASALYKAGADYADSMALDAARTARAAIAKAKGEQ